MGGFHCPLGAMAPGTEGCIHCGLCTAGTREAYAKAAEKLRAYIRENVPRPRRVEKIAVCGKGGVGKSTVTAAFARAFSSLGYRVLVLDTDESNPTLARALGLPPCESMLKRPDSRFEPAESPSWLREDLDISDIPADYLSAAGNLMLVTAGKLEDPFAGCACSIGALAQLLMLNLELQEGEVVIADTEAGVESFGRGVERGADTVIAVAEPSLDSLEVAEKVKYMAEGLGISRFRTILNKVPDEETAELLTEYLEGKDIRYLGWLGQEKEVVRHGLAGTPLDKTEDAYLKLENMLKLFLDENEMDYPL